MLKGEQRRLQRYAIESIPARVCEGVRTWFTILVLSDEIPYRALCEGLFDKSAPQKNKIFSISVKPQYSPGWDVALPQKPVKYNYS